MMAKETLFVLICTLTDRGLEKTFWAWEHGV